MGSSIGQRLKEFFDSLNLSQTDAAIRLNYPKQNISSWIKGKTNVTTAFLPVLLDEFKNLDARWLLTGEGDMLIKANEKPYTQTIPQRNAQEPTPPLISPCKQCEEYKMIIDDLRLTKDLLLEKISDLERRHCCPGENEGGVEAPAKTG